MCSWTGGEELTGGIGKTVENQIGEVRRTEALLARATSQCDTAGVGHGDEYDIGNVEYWNRRSDAYQEKESEDV